MVSSIDSETVVIGSETVRSATVIWAAGVQASPLGRSIGAHVDKIGRVLVEPDLSVPGHPEVFVIRLENRYRDSRRSRSNKAIMPP